MLADKNWELKYTRDDGDLVRRFYVPALKDAVRYDRLTGYFGATALALAARGIEGLVRNGGTMRLVVGCTLKPGEIEAIQEGERLRDLVEEHLAESPLEAPDDGAKDALELLAWMVARGHLEVKVAVPCDARQRPVPDDSIFHEKTGIIEDQAGDRIAWSGSLNETEAGWRRNWEGINVFTSWGDRARVAVEEDNFRSIWNDEVGSVIVIDVPEAVRRDLLRFLPQDGGVPASLKSTDLEYCPPRVPKSHVRAPSGDFATKDPSYGRRARVWSFIAQAPSLPPGGARVGEATAAVTPWPHQVRAFHRLYDKWPPRLLIADEVGLGKTIQAGLLLRQAWLSGRAKRILVMAPKAVLGQWQTELHEKFNLNWPIYDAGTLAWRESPAWKGRAIRRVDEDRWHEEPAVIASSHLMRRKERRNVLLKEAAPWDLVVLDEAHHARRRGAGSTGKYQPNTLLRLMLGLRLRTEGLLLLTATPMQVHPVELWDLLDLLGLPPEWKEGAFLDFFEKERPDPSAAAFDRMAHLFQAAERYYGADREDGRLLAELDGAEAGSDPPKPGLTRMQGRRILRALRDEAATPRRQLSSTLREAAVRLIRSNTPVRYLVSRHTRERLRRYHQAGLLASRIAQRSVEDRFVKMTPDERSLYRAVEGYIATTYKRASDHERRAVGFVMTVYRRRLASSFHALRNTLRRRLNPVKGGQPTGATADEDVSDDELWDNDSAPDPDEVRGLEKVARSAEEEAVVRRLLAQVDRLPSDSKVGVLKDVLDSLRSDGYPVMVFTQYTDTMDFLREELGKETCLALMCYSGRGGEAPGAGGTWSTISRSGAKRRFRKGEADVLLCTEAAAEGLNFQFCGALVNYDMPWNPMRVEQRIGRIDRVGQHHSVIRIINLHYEDTVETDIYRVLQERIGLFTNTVGRLQPILARLPGKISRAVLTGRGQNGDGREGVVKSVEQDCEASTGLDIDAALGNLPGIRERPPSPVTMKDLDRVIRSPELMPPGTEVRSMKDREYVVQAPGTGEPVRVTTDRDYYEEHADSVEFWSPGNTLFPAPEHHRTANQQKWPPGTTLEDVLKG